MTFPRLVGSILAGWFLASAPPAGAAPAQGAPPSAPPRNGAARAKLQEVLRLLRNEPSIEEVHRWALQHHALGSERIASLRRNARLKGLVPEVEAGFDQSLGNTSSNMRDGLYPTLPNPPENPNPGSYKERVLGRNDQMTWRVRAVWSLDRLVFNSESLDVMSLVSLQETLVREVTTLYYTRRRLIAGLVVNPPEGDLDWFMEMARLDELTATLDGLTGGKFASRAWKAVPPNGR